MMDGEVWVHGLCNRCRLYVSGYVRRAVPITDEGVELPLHVHYTINCPRCEALINLISVDREPLKMEAKARA